MVRDGTLNASVSCLDRHLADRGDDTAIIWEGDDPNVSEHVTYRHCTRKSAARQRDARLGVKKGDVVTIYMPMVVRRRSRCWPARASAPFIPSCSEAFRPTAWPSHSGLRFHAVDHRR